jgi:hypothetical protein
MMNPLHPRLSIVRQSELASISRAVLSCSHVENEGTLRLMRLMTSSIWRRRGTARVRCCGICGATAGAFVGVASAA